MPEAGEFINKLYIQISKKFFIFENVCFQYFFKIFWYIIKKISMDNLFVKTACLKALMKDIAKL